MIDLAEDWMIVLFATAGLHDFVDNSLKTIKRCGIDPAIVNVVFPARAISEFFGFVSGLGAKPRILEEVIGDLELGEMPNAYVEYGTPEFNRLMRARLPVIRALSRECKTILCADVDIVWFVNPLPYLSEVLKKYPMAFQTEALPCFPPNFCAGFFALRCAPEGLDLIDAHIAEFSAASPYTMQMLLNRIVEENPRYLFNIFPLPEALFANGLLHSAIATKDVNPSNLVSLLQPFTFHANFTIGIENKRNLLRRIGMWQIETAN